MRKQVKHERKIPKAEVPPHEAWLYNNPKALASVLEGLMQAEKGKLCKLDIDFNKIQNSPFSQVRKTKQVF